MTVVVASRETGEMAADTQWTVHGAKMRAKKVYRVARGALIGIAGEVASGLLFVRWYERGCPEDAVPELNEEFGALVLDRNGLFQYDDSCFPMPVYGEFWAIGAGTPYALAAMHLGKSPLEAARVACDLDESCGLPVEVARLRE